MRFVLLMSFVVLLPLSNVAAQDHDSKPGSQSGPKPADSKPAKTGAVSYFRDIAPIIRANCLTCHSGEDPAGGFVLTSYDAVRKRTEHGELLARINDLEYPMPESGLLPVALRQKIKSWAAGGYIRGKKTVKPASAGTSNGSSVAGPLKPVKFRAVGPEGLEFLKRMQGHWLGSMVLMGRKYQWFAFDYRPIGPAHVHGLFEGGTIGNLFTSFFLANYRGKKTLMARNGGLLNGIYRTSYFILDQINGDSYRFVDALGGAQVMWMELKFKGDSLEFRSYTSGLGTKPKPTLHMSFRGRKGNLDLAKKAAKTVGFPRDKVFRNWPNGLPIPNWGKQGPARSASYLWQSQKSRLKIDRLTNFVTLGKWAGDPVRLDHIPTLASLSLTIQRRPATQNTRLLIYLSKKALSDQQGKLILDSGALKTELGNSILLFPELAKTQSAITLTYLHPGQCYLTVVADLNADGFATAGDISSPSQLVVLNSKKTKTISIQNLTVKN